MNHVYQGHNQSGHCDALLQVLQRSLLIEQSLHFSLLLRNV